MTKKWVTLQPDQKLVRKIASDLNISRLTGTVLINRGIKDSRQAQDFLRPDLSQLIDPFKFEQMEGAVERVNQAMLKNQKITIYGDYDVDGITSTAVLLLFFRLLGKNPDYFIPERLKEGYGLNKTVIEKLAQSGTGLIIAVDCGTSAYEEIDLAKKMGIDTIVIDHHEQTSKIPPACAIINPKLKGSGYSFKGLCSCALAFKFAWALSENMPAIWKQSDKYREYLVNSFAFVTLATIADVAPLVHENRVFVHYGLESLRCVTNKGLQRLLEIVGLAPITGLASKSISTFDISFKIAPRLNAIARMGQAIDCLELLITEDQATIGRIVQFSEEANRKRQQLEQNVLQNALAKIEVEGLHEDKVIVVQGDGWHPGVIGIVATRLMEIFSRPVVVISVRGEKARASARSNKGFNLSEALKNCEDLLINFGGHEQAAGFDIVPSKIKELRAKMNSLAQMDEDYQETIYIDTDISISELSVYACKELSRLQPHGPGNPEPVFALRDVNPAGELKLMGKKEQVLSFYVKDGVSSIRVVAFQRGDLFDRIRGAKKLTLAGAPKVSNYYSDTVEFLLKDIA